MNAPVEADDGIRVCIMQNANVYNRQLKGYLREYGRKMYDYHLKQLAPSKKLKKDFRNEDVTWKEYQQIYHREVLKPQAGWIMIVAYLALKQNITLLCSEKYVPGKPLHCHRVLDAEECKKYEPTLEILIR